MTHAPSDVYAQPTINRWGNVGFAFGAMGLLLSWMPFIGGLGVLLAFLGLICAFVGIIRAPRTNALAGLLLSAAGIAQPFLIFAYCN